MSVTAGPEIERLMALLARLPGLGPRSARRATLALLKRREQLLLPLAEALNAAAETVRACRNCGALDSRDPCTVCSDEGRDGRLVCVVEDAGALWALERGGSFGGRYHVLGGLLSALDGVRPEDLRIQGLLDRLGQGQIEEVILALPATVDGQTTVHYIQERIRQLGNSVRLTSLARGVPVGGDLDWLDDGTISQALQARRTV